MSYLVTLTTSQCFSNAWIPVYGVYWAVSSTSTTAAKIHMSKTGGYCPGGEGKYIKIGASALFGNNKFTVKLEDAYKGEATIRISEAPKEPNMIKAQIISVRLDKTVYNVGASYNVGDIIKSECVVKNIGGSGIIYLKTGLGYLDSSDMIFLTGAPVDDQLFLNYQQFYTFKQDIKVDITDYYRQRGIGWAYLQQQMYLFFLVGHKVDGDIIWDAEKHIKIYVNEPEGFKDPTALDESIIGGIPEIIDDAIPAFGGLGGLGGIWDDAKPDTKDVIDWIADKLTPEPKEPPEEPMDITPFLYIGFAGLVGYLLVRSQ